MKNKKLEFKYIILIILLVITIFLGVFSITKNDDRKLSKVEIVLKDTITFIQKVTYFPFKQINKQIIKYKSFNNIYKENEDLKIKVEKYELEKTRNTELQDEIEALKELNDIENILSAYEYLNASIITRNISVWHDTINIDKGSNNGIEVGMAVITAKGLIGQISNTTQFTSTVRLITNNSSNNKISVIIKGTISNQYGVINGYSSDASSLVVEGAGTTEGIKKGDVVSTSGLGGVYPSGILVGYVENITTDEYDLAKLLEVKPSANINDIKYVSIIKREALK